MNRDKLKVANLDTYHGETIHIDTHNRFLVESLEQSYPTIDEAYKAIERKHKAEAAVKKESFQPLAVLDSQGMRHEITGIHAGHGTRLFRPDLPKSGYREDAYPDVPIIAAMLKRRMELQEESNDIYKRLQEFLLVSPSKPYGEVPDLPKIYKRVIEDYTSKKEAAEKCSLSQTITA